MSKTIGVILSLKNSLSEQMKPAIVSLKQAKEQVLANEKQLELYKAAVDQAKINIAQYSKELEKLKKNTIKQNTEYQKAKTEVDSLKNSSKQLQSEILKQSIELNELAKKYGANSEQYKNASRALQTLKQQYENNNIIIKEQSSNLEKLKNDIIENSEAVKAFKSNEASLNDTLKEAKENVRKQQKELVKVGETFKKTEKDVEQSKNKFKEWSKSVGQSIDGAVKSAIKWGTATASLVGGIALNKGLTTSVNLEAYRTMLETATKDFEKTTQLMKQAEKLSISTPFDPEEVIQATATLESYNISSEKWLSKIADAAGATNKTMEQATEAVKNILTKNEFESMENLGISKEMIIEASEKKYGKNKVFNKKGQVKDQEKLEIVLEEIMTSKFDGGAEKLSKTIKGLWSTITGSVNMGLAKILGMENGLIKSGSILDIIKQKMKLISDIILKWQEDGTLDKVAQQMTVAFTEIVDSIVKAYNFIKDNNKAIGAILKLLGIVYLLVKGVFALKAAFEAYQIAVTALSSIGFLVNVFNKIKLAIAGFNLMLASTPVGWITAGVAAIAFALYMLIFEFDKVKSFVTKLWDTLVEFANGMPDWAKTIVLAFSPIVAVIKGLGKVWEYVSSLFGGDDIKKNIEVTNATKEEIKTMPKNDIASSVPKKEELLKQAYSTAPPQLNSVKANALNSARINNSNVPKQQQTIINIHGDMYGYKDFKEKVAGAVLDINKLGVANIG